MKNHLAKGAGKEKPDFSFEAQVWLYSGKGAWHFVSAPLEAGARIRFLSPAAKGFVPVPVKAATGSTAWETSIFPDKKSGSYLLAIKADVRKRGKISAGDTIRVELTLRNAART